MMDYARSFCSYIKHGERGRLKHRAIASASVINSMFTHITEEFHLKLGKVLLGSTISIRGEEKMKIMSLLNTTTLNTTRPVY